jgi:hypothetical protein
MMQRAFYAFFVVNAQMILSARWKRTRGRVLAIATSPTVLVPNLHGAGETFGEALSGTREVRALPAITSTKLDAMRFQYSHTLRTYPA